MSHTDTNYSLLRKTSKVNGALIQVVLYLYNSKTNGNKFGNPGKGSRNIEAIAIDCHCPMSFSERVAIEPRLDEYRFTAEDLPSCLTLGCEDTTHEEAQAIVGTHGEPEVAWSPVVDIQ